MEKKTGVYVLEDGDGSMVARAWLSEYAEKTIDVQYFIFSTDNVGLIIILLSLMKCTILEIRMKRIN